MRRAARVDNNQREIVAALRAIGCKVYDLRRPMDLLVQHRGRLLIVECKNTKETGHGLTKKQKDFLDCFGVVNVRIVETVDQAIQAVCQPPN
jgi:hypothetical protein